MGIVVKISYVYSVFLLGSKMATIVSIGIGAIIYTMSLFLIGTITSKDLEILPKGEKLAKKLRKIGLLRY